MPQSPMVALGHREALDDLFHRQADDADLWIDPVPHRLGCEHLDDLPEAILAVGIIFAGGPHQVQVRVTVV